MKLATDITFHLKPGQRVEFREKRQGRIRWAEIAVVDDVGECLQEISFMGSDDQISAILGRQEAAV